MDVAPEILARVSAFSTCTPEQRARLVEAAEVTEHDRGETLTAEGVIGHRFHLLLEGEAAVERDGRRIASLGVGEFVGEIGLLGGGPSTATVRCLTPTRCLTLWRERFWRVLEAEPAIALRILEVVCRRLESEFTPGPTANLSRR